MEHIVLDVELKQLLLLVPGLIVFEHAFHVFGVLNGWCSHPNDITGHEGGGQGQTADAEVSKFSHVCCFGSGGGFASAHLSSGRNVWVVARV